jgi:hypothetical protein
MSTPSTEKRFCPKERPVQELLEGIDPREALEEPLCVLVLHAAAEALGLHRLPEPKPLLRLSYVAEVVTGRLAVDSPELVHRLLRRLGALSDRARRP